MSIVRTRAGLSTSESAGDQPARRGRVGGLGVAVLWCAAFLALSSPPAWSADARLNRTSQNDTETVRRVTITINKSRTIHLPTPFATAVIGAPDMADALPMSDRSLYILAKKIGTTNVTLYDQASKVVGVIDVEVAIDTGNLQDKIRSSTGNSRIRVSSSNGQVILSGEATDAVAADRAVTVAKAFSPNGVVNAMSIASTQQVLLKVRFIEASRDAGRQLGVNWFASNANGTRGVNTGSGGLINGTPTNATPGGIPLIQTAGTLTGTTTAPFGVVLASLASGGTNIDILVTALETQGLIRRLAEPNLMALSGDTAQFLAGGEFPVPIAATSASGIVTPTIEFKPFGVRLSFTPTVLAHGIINLRIAPEVSELDFSNKVEISGTTIPSLVKRDAVTTVELRDGQSFAIAGLLQANDLRDRSQIPWLGSVPVLGPLFSSVSYQKHETDLMIIVTPYLVRPATPGQRLATPLDDRLPSNDVDFFLLGQNEVAKKTRTYVGPAGDVHGPYGHLIRPQPDPR